MKQALLFSFVFICSSCATFVQPEFRLESITNYGAYNHIQLPLTFDAGIYPYVEINIQGRTFAFHVDTGDEVSNLSLTTSQMNDLHFEYTDIKYRANDMDGNIVTKYFFELPDVQIADYSLESILCTESLQRPAPYLMDVGVIGWNLLKQFNLLVDYKDSLLTLYKKGSLAEDPDVSNWNRIALNSDPPLTFAAKLEKYDKVLRMGIDTGSVMMGSTADNCVVTNLIRIELPESVLSQYEISYFMSNLDFPIVPGVTVNSGESTITNLDFLYYRTAQPRNRAGFLGGDFLRKYQVFIDNMHDVLYYRMN
jgi:hypothetical protein